MPPRHTTQQPWTLRFKKHKTTILLLVQATQPFHSIKQDLLSSIKETGKADINGANLPSDASDIIFGVPIDKHDPSQGWVDLDIKPENGDTKSEKSRAIFNESPIAAGLKDGAVLAFKFAGEEGDWDVIMPSYEDEESASQSQ